MRIPVSGLVRSAVALTAGAGLVVAAMQAQGAVQVGPTGQDATVGTSAARAVRGAALTCPGPELKGLPGLPDLPVGVRVAASAAPLRTITGTPGVSPEPGEVGLAGMPGRALGAPVTTRSATASADLTSPAGVLATATQSLAPGLAAAQSWLVRTGDQRSLGSVPCTRAGADFWLMAGTGAPGRQERLVLTNPGGNPVSVDITLHGPAGPVDSAQGAGVVVPAHGRTAFLLDSISGDLASPVVHVVADGGVVGAVVNDTWLDGTRAGGSDDAVPTAPPSTDQVVPAVAVSGAAVLRIAVPGADEAVVQARVLTAQGPRALPTGGVIRIAGGSVRDIDISGLPEAAVGLQIRADVPVVASAVVTRSRPGAPGDFAWSVSTPPITGVAGMPLVDPPGAPKPLARKLSLTATADTVGVEVVTVDAQGAEHSQRLTVGADATTALDVTGAAAVWVHRVSGSGALRAGVISWLVDDQGVLLTTTPLLDSALRTTTVGLREVRH